MKRLRDRRENNILDDVHLGTSSVYSPYGTIGTTHYNYKVNPIDTTYGNSYGPAPLHPQITRYFTGDTNVLVHNTGTGVAFPQPLIIPGIGPNNSTTVV